MSAIGIHLFIRCLLGRQSSIRKCCKRRTRANPGPARTIYALISWSHALGASFSRAASLARQPVARYSPCWRAAALSIGARYPPPSRSDARRKESTMSNISVQKKENNDVSTLSRREWEPFRMMCDMLRWDPFREIAPAFVAEPSGLSPAFEIKETKDAFVFKADVPGIKEPDIEVNVVGNRLTVSGKRDAEKEEKGARFYTYERSYGGFTRSFTLPDQADASHEKAELTNGELTVVIPKAAAAVAKRFAVTSGVQPQA